MTHFITMSTSSSSSAPPPLAKADDAGKMSPDNASAIQEDAPPSLEGMPTAIWEQSLSFLPPAGISNLSHRISKTLGAGEDKDESPDKAAKLALESMMKFAWKDASVTFDHVSADDDYIDPSKSYEQMLCVPRLEGESYLRTYHIAIVMLKAGEQKLEETVADTTARFHVTIVMWLLYGRPPLPPLSELEGSVAKTMAAAISLQFVPSFDFVLRKPIDTEEERQKQKDKFIKYNQYRLLRLADRLGKIGQHSNSSTLLTMLAYGRPHMLRNRHVLQAEFPMGARVMLKGLSRKELNGKIGTIEKEYKESNERIGVGISENYNGESRNRIVGIKAINLELLEEDTDFLLDVKITHAHHLTRCIEINDGFMPDWVPLVVHTLRRIVAKLHDNYDIETKDVKIIDADSACSIFLTKPHRLIIAQTSLTILLTFIAKVTAMGLRPCQWSGLVCSQYDKILALTEPEDDDDEDDEEMIDRTVRIGVTQAYLGECVEIIKFCEETHTLIKEQKATYGLLKEKACAYFHYNAGCLGRGLGFPFVAMNNVGVEDVGGATEDHIMVAVAGLRTEFEDLLDAYAFEAKGSLTVDGICSTGKFPHSYTRYFVSLAHSLANAYRMTATGMIEVGPFSDTGEGSDYTIFSKFALAVAVRCFGRGHPFTDTIGKFHDNCSGTIIWGNQVCVFRSGLQAEVDEWLHGYVPLYYGTKRQHPALFHRIAGLEQEEEE